MIHLLARSEHGPELVNEIVRRAAAATGATASVILRLDAATGRLTPMATADSGARTERPWIVEGPEAVLAAEILTAGRLRQIKLEPAATPELATRLGTKAAILAPVIHAGLPIGLLILGVPAVVPALEWSSQVSECAGALAMTLVDTEMRQEMAMRREIQRLVAALGRSATPAIPLDQFEQFCVNLASVIKARRVELWQYNRRTRAMDRMVPGADEATDPFAEAARSEAATLVTQALREQRAAMIVPHTARSDDGETITVPLAGRRRALGVLLILGLRVEPGGRSRSLELLEDLGPQLANVIEGAQLLDDVLRLARTEALGHLVAGIAHELNNPLQGVLGHIELLQRLRQMPPALTSGLRQIYRESDRAARIVRNLLVLAGSGQVTKHPVSVNAALRRALALRAAPCRRAKIQTVRRLSATVPTIQGDALLLQQAFLNLLINAEQAINGRPGRIDVRSSYSAKRREIVVEVKDSGSGFAPEVLPRVFDPFFTTKDAGSGLGLAMTLRIVREHDGDVVAAPRRGGGAVLTVTLPVPPRAKR